jgi:regulator of extracellular matrix RemA (YlzA/DUF370 family)
MDSGNIVLSALPTETISARLAEKADIIEQEADVSDEK